MLEPAKIIRTEITRTVVLWRNWAIKFPSFRYGYRFFLMGLLANTHERMWWRDTGHDERLCPVLRGCPLGLWLVMPFAEDIEDIEIPEEDAFYGLPLDYKVDNFGRYDGRIVLRDYGS